jgi:hypothetical protein
MWQNFIIFLIAILIIIFTSSYDDNPREYRVNFNGIRSERLYNKNTGEIIGDKVGKL